MPSALRTLAPGASIFSDGPFDLRLSEHRLSRRGTLQVGLRAFSDGLPLTSVHLRALQTSIVRRWGVGFAAFPAVGNGSFWLAPPLALDYHYRPPPGLADFEALRSCAADVRVFLPINLCNEHWLRGEADMLRGSLTFFDSDIITSGRHSPLLDLALQRVQAAAISLGRHVGE